MVGYPAACLAILQKTGSRPDGYIQEKTELLENSKQLLAKQAESDKIIKECIDLIRDLDQRVLDKARRLHEVAHPCSLGWAEESGKDNSSPAHGLLNGLEVNDS